MTIPAAWTTALGNRGNVVDLWLEIEGVPWAFGMTTRAASWFAARPTVEERLGVKALMPEVPRGVQQQARPLDGESSIGEMSVKIMDDGAGVVRSLVAGVGRTDHWLYMHAPAHQTSHAYALHDVVYLTDASGDQWVFRCYTAGTTAATAPDFTPLNNVGDAVQDGTAWWLVIAKAYDLTATGSETYLPYTGTADAAQYPTNGGTIYLGRETLTYTARTAGTNGAGYFSGVTRGVYALPGRTAKTAHTWGDEMTPYLPFLATRRALLHATLDGTDANRLARWGGTVTNAKATTGLHGYELTMNSLDGELRVKAFAGQRTGKLAAGLKSGTGAYTPEGASEPAAEASKVRLVAASMSGAWTAGQTLIAKVGDEYVAGTIETDVTGTYINLAGTGPRGLFATSAVQHPPGEEVAEVVWTGAYDAAGTGEYRFSKFTRGDHPLEILLCWLTSRLGDGANGTYDVLPDGWGLGIDASRVDVAGIEALARSWLPGVRHLWLYSEPFGFKEEIANLLRPHLCFPVVTLGDKLTIRRLSPPIPGENITPLSVSAVTAIPTWEANSVDVIGFVNWLCDYDAIEDEHRQKFIGDFLKARRNYAGQFQTLDVEARGQFTGNDPGSAGFFGANLNTNASNTAMRYMETIRDRYTRPWPIIGVECLYSQLGIEPGDLVSLTMAHLPDTETGGDGLSGALCEVLSKQIDDAQGKVRFSLLQTFAATSRLIAPGLPVSVIAGAKLTLADADMIAAGFDAYTSELYVAGDVVEVWSANLLTSRGTATVTVVADSAVAGAVDVTVNVLPAGTVVGDVVMPAAYDSSTASQRGRYAYLADAAGGLGSGPAPAHLYAI